MAYSLSVLPRKNREIPRAPETGLTPWTCRAPASLIAHPGGPRTRGRWTLATSNDPAPLQLPSWGCRATTLNRIYWLLRGQELLDFQLYPWAGKLLMVASIAFRLWISAS